MPSQVPISIPLFLIHLFIWQKYFHCPLYVPAQANHSLQDRTVERIPLYCALDSRKNTRLLPHSHCCNKVYIASKLQSPRGGCLIQQSQHKEVDPVKEPGAEQPVSK